MALYMVSASDPIIPDDVNQIYTFLNGLTGDNTLIKEFTGSIGSSATAIVAHGLSHVPRLVYGYWGTTQSGADAGDSSIITGYPNIGTNVVYFGSAASFTSKTADGTNIYIKNGFASTVFYRVYVI